MWNQDLNSYKDELLLSRLSMELLFLILPSNSSVLRKKNKLKCTSIWLLRNGFPTYILPRFYSPEHLLWSCFSQKHKKHFKLYFTIYLELIHSKCDKNLFLLFQMCKIKLDISQKSRSFNINIWKLWLVCHRTLMITVF